MLFDHQRAQGKRGVMLIFAGRRPLAPLAYWALTITQLYAPYVTGIIHRAHASLHRRRGPGRANQRRTDRLTLPAQAHRAALCPSWKRCCCCCCCGDWRRKSGRRYRGRSRSRWSRRPGWRWGNVGFQNSRGLFPGLWCYPISCILACTGLTRESAMRVTKSGGTDVPF